MGHDLKLNANQERNGRILTFKRQTTLPQAQKAQFVEELGRNPEGRDALEEAKRTAHALEQRFGSSDPRSFKKELDRLHLADTAKIERINEVARIGDRANRAELSQKYELTRGLKKGLGLGMSHYRSEEHASPRNPKPVLISLGFHQLRQIYHAPPVPF
ncbi:hypothetical protein N182_37925 [Sinorhizobium sp. GL2]|nr:hypothetical protein N182_37925 [Sinorhizobium sp. GL2]